jgi:23S rRNA (uracil1939-C5)-methyltransferase
MTEFSTILECDFFPLCSGCEFHGDVSSPPVWQNLKNFFSGAANISNIPLKINKITGWRHRAKLAVRGKVGFPEIGLFKHGSHQVVSIPTCPLHHPSINKVCAKVRKVMIDHKIEAYNEDNNSGLLRYLQCVVDGKSDRVQLTLVVNRKSKDAGLEKYVKQLYKECELHSLWLNFQSEKTNKIFGNEWLLCEGEPYLWEALGQRVCAFHPACFGQAHRTLFVQVLQQIHNWVKPHQRVLELYAGVGVIGLNLVEKSKEVICVEINSFAAECFHLSRLKLPIEFQRKISMQISSSEKALSMIAGKDVVIVDPPRKGVEPEVLEALCAAERASQLIYLSCGPLSFQRDCEKLLAHGWRIEKAEGYLFFPGSDHVEILCNFKRKNLE